MGGGPEPLRNGPWGGAGPGRSGAGQRPKWARIRRMIPGSSTVATVGGDDLLDRGVGRGLGGDVQLDGAKIDGVLGGILPRLGDLRRVAACRLAHAGIP